jgi:hypothetical protein
MPLLHPARLERNCSGAPVVTSIQEGVSEPSGTKSHTHHCSTPTAAAPGTDPVTSARLIR